MPRVDAIPLHLVGDLPRADMLAYEPETLVAWPGFRQLFEPDGNIALVEATGGDGVIEDGALPGWGMALCVLWQHNVPRHIVASGNMNRQLVDLFIRTLPGWAGQNMIIPDGTSPLAGAILPGMVLLLWLGMRHGRGGLLDGAMDARNAGEMTKERRKGYCVPGYRGLIDWIGIPDAEVWDSAIKFSSYCWGRYGARPPINRIKMLVRGWGRAIQLVDPDGQHQLSQETTDTILMAISAYLKSRVGFESKQRNLRYRFGGVYGGLAMDEAVLKLGRATLGAGIDKDAKLELLVHAVIIGRHLATTWNGMRTCREGIEELVCQGAIFKGTDATIWQTVQEVDTDLADRLRAAVSAAKLSARGACVGMAVRKRV